MDMVVRPRVHYVYYSLSMLLMPRVSSKRMVSSTWLTAPPTPLEHLSKVVHDLGVGTSLLATSILLDPSGCYRFFLEGSGRNQNARIVVQVTLSEA